MQLYDILPLVIVVAAFVDFADSGDVEESAVDDVSAGVASLRLEVLRNLQDARAGQLLRSGKLPKHSFHPMISSRIIFYPCPFGQNRLSMSYYKLHGLGDIHSSIFHLE